VADGPPERLGQLGKQRVDLRLAQLVVDVLGVVELDHQQRERAVVGTARFASWPISASANFWFQIPVTGSTTPKSGLDDVSDWLCPQTWQYCSCSPMSEPQYQQIFTGRHCIRRVQNSIWDGPGRALSERGGRPAGAPA